MTFKHHASNLAAAMSLSVLLAAAPAHAAQIGAADYKAGKAKIRADFKADKLACDSLTANAKDVCREEAKAKEKNAMAALEYGHTGKPADGRKMLTVKVGTAYDVAKEKCDDQTGNAKDVCVQQAKAVQTKGMAEAKLVKDVAQAGRDLTETTREADLKLADEKCDALTGDAKSTCQSAAQARFGKR
jgi:gamma-glutamyl:cysteine ligase YbdK (ATP-grasp superfamily)